MAPPRFLGSDLLSRRGRARALVEPFIRSRASRDETVREFFTRRFGVEVADVLADALVAGVFGGDSGQTSMAAAFPAITRMEAESGGVVRGMIAMARERKRRGESRQRSTPIRSFDQGMGVLIDALCRGLGNRMRSGIAVSSIRTNPRGFRIESETGPPMLARRVLVATPAHAGSRLLRDGWPGIAGQLDAIPYAGIAVVGLVYPRSQVGHPLDGFGFLVPRGQGPRLIGCLWPGSIFQEHVPADRAYLRVMLGGARDPEGAMLADGKTVDLARKEVERLLQVSGTPLTHVLYRHPRGIPQYTVGHLERIARLDADVANVPGLYLAGNAYHGVGVNDCIREAARVAERLVAAAEPETAPQPEQVVS